MKQILFLLFLAFLSTDALAESPLSGITPCSSSSLSVTGTTGNTLLSGCGPTTVLWNIGANEVFIALGSTSTQAATTSNMSVPAGTGVTLNTSNTPLYLAAITGASTSTLRITQGWGFPQLSGGTSGGGSGTPSDVVGTLGNNVDAVAPTTTGNLGTDSYNYGWNGTGWDRLQVDTSKNLKIGQGTTPWVDNITSPLGAAQTSPTLPVAVVEPDDFNVCTGGNTCTATGATTLFTQDMLGYSSMGIDITVDTNGNTVVYEQSEDNVDWKAVSGLSISTVGTNGCAISDTTAVGRQFPKRYEFFRARVSVFVSGTVTVTARLHKNAAPICNSNSSLQSGAQSIGTVGLNAGTNSIGSLNGFTYTHITTAATTTPKSGAGVLHTICVNSLGTISSSITVDDATSATTPTIAVINSLTLLGCQTFDVAFATGLTLVTTGTVAPDITVSWR